MGLTIETALRTGAERRTGGLREVVVLALPVILTNLSSTLMMTADTVMVGRLGATELGGVGYAGIWYWTVLSLFNGTASGVQTFVAQAHGAGDARTCGGWAWQAIYAVVPAATVALTLFALGFGPLLTLLQPAGEMQVHATTYVHARVFGILGFATAWVLAGFLRGVGDTRTPLYAMIAANVIDFILNIGLIFGRFGLPAWGVYGAGISTAIAEWAYAAILFVAFRRRVTVAAYRTEWRPPDWVAIRRFLRTSAPIGGQWVLDMLAFAGFSTLVARMGAAEMAASQALITLMHLSFMQVVGVSVAVSTLVGRYVGARDLEAAERSHDTGMRLGVGLAVAVGLLFVLAPDFCLGLLIRESTVLQVGVPLLAVGAAFQIFDAVGVISGAALRGAGDTRWPFAVQTMLAWGLFLPVAYLGGVVLDGGLGGAWLGGVVYVLVLGVALRWRVRSGAWHAVRI